MWNISIARAHRADEDLASLSIDSPRNLRTSDEFGLLVGLWCGRVRDQLMIGETICTFSFGFFAGEVVAEPRNGRILNQGRLEVEAGRFKVVKTESDEMKKEGNLGAQLGIDFLKWFGFGKTGVDMGGHLKKTVSKAVQKNGEHYQIFWRVADAGYNFWRVFGIGLNEAGILEYKIIGDEPICHITANEDVRSIEVQVSFRCDLRDLWFERENNASSPRDTRFNESQDERNRVAVARRVIGKALNRRTAEVNATSGTGVVVLAKQNLSAVKDSESSDLSP